MRILFVQHSAIHNGSAVSGRLIVEGFRAAGWKVDVAFGFHGPYSERYRELGCGVHVVPHKNWLRGGNVVQSARRIHCEWRNTREFVRLMRLVRPDVVYINSLVSLAAAVAAKRLRLPTIWHIRELFDDVGGEMRVPAFGGRRLVRALLRRLSSRRIAISRAVSENIFGAAGDADATIIPNAVPAEFFAEFEDRATCRRRLGLPVEGPIVGVPGTLRPVKGHPFFLAAAARLADSHPDCRFAVTGAGEPKYVAELKRQAEALGISAKTRFLGVVDDMRLFYRACDVVCVPSRSESFGRTVIEAFAVGVPVVASAVGGMLEIVEDGRSGFLIAFGDDAALAGRIKELLESADLRQRLTERAQTVAWERFGAEACQARINAIVAESRSATSRRPYAAVAARSLS